MQVLFPVAKFWSNVDIISGSDRSICQFINILSRTCTPEGQLPLDFRRAWRDEAPKLDAAVKKITAALGVPLTLQVDPYELWVGLGVECKDRMRLPDALPRYFEGLAANLAKACADSMVKEALQEALSAKLLRVELVQGVFTAEQQKKYGNKGYVGISFENGALTVMVPTKRFWSNMDEIKEIKVDTML